MATYKITYLEGNSYSKKRTFDVSNAIDENDAVELAVYKYNLSDAANIVNVEFVCE